MGDESCKAECGGAQSPNPLNIMSKEVKEALTYMKQAFLQWNCLNLPYGFLSLGKEGGRERLGDQSH